MVNIMASFGRCALLLLLACTVRADSDTSGEEGTCLSESFFYKGVLHTDFNPAFLSTDNNDLIITSFFNTDTSGNLRLQDSVLRISDLQDLDIEGFDAATDLEVLIGDPDTGIVWPNEAEIVPERVLDFDAVVIPQGFFRPGGFPGRLTILNTENGVEYVVQQSTRDASRFYHRVLYIDMDDDGLKDFVTVRSDFQIPPTGPANGELVWFKNPGSAIDPAVPWAESILYGGTIFAFGPDITLTAADLEGDGVPEIVATRFFSSGLPPGYDGIISIYGAEAGRLWSETTPSTTRTNDIAIQGLPFDVLFVDLNKDGKMDILATNHQPDNCSPPFFSGVKGQVFALEQPAGGNLFVDPWPIRVLLDDILPQPNPVPRSPPGRLAPGGVRTFFPEVDEDDSDDSDESNSDEDGDLPWILVGGDQAGKVWVLEPLGDWEYNVAVIFDINDTYGPGTTQTPAPDRFNKFISTIGLPAVRYTESGYAEIYIPVFEAGDIHVISFEELDDSDEDESPCLEDITLDCPVFPPPPPIRHLIRRNGVRDTYDEATLKKLAYEDTYTVLGWPFMED